MRRWHSAASSPNVYYTTAVDVATTLASALGLGLLAGVRLYATTFAVGLLLHFHWIELPERWTFLRNPILAACSEPCRREW
jgi:hypothetical protein